MRLLRLLSNFCWFFCIWWEKIKKRVWIRISIVQKSKKKNRLHFQPNPFSFCYDQWIFHLVVCLGLILLKECMLYLNLLMQNSWRWSYWNFPNLMVMAIRFIGFGKLNNFFIAMIGLWGSCSDGRIPFGSACTNMVQIVMWWWRRAMLGRLLLLSLREIWTFGARQFYRSIG